MNAFFSRFGSPILGEDVDEIYNNIYGECGKEFLEVLETSPYEVAVISRLIAYLQQRLEGGQ